VRGGGENSRESYQVSPVAGRRSEQPKNSNLKGWRSNRLRLRHLSSTRAPIYIFVGKLLHFCWEVTSVVQECASLGESLGYRYEDSRDVGTMYKRMEEDGSC
jgi:hypothetical protein